MNSDPLTFSFYQASADYLTARIKEKPQIGIILGSSLGAVADRVTDRVEIPYAEVPNMLRSTVASHAGKFVFGRLGGKPVVIMSGRFHHYEGYSYEQLAQPVRVMKLLGISTLILTNAAGGVNLDYHVGDVMIIDDQIKLNGHSPMHGPNLAEFGERFFDCSHIYTPHLINLAQRRAEALGYGDKIHRGVYYFCPGPNFETPAEIRAIRILGGDAVGMSTVTEALTAAHAGIDVLGFSLITNMAAGVLNQPLSDDEVGVVARQSSGMMTDLISDILAHLD